MSQLNVPIGFSYEHSDMLPRTVCFGKAERKDSSSCGISGFSGREKSHTTMTACFGVKYRKLGGNKEG